MKLSVSPPPSIAIFLAELFTHTDALRIISFLIMHNAFLSGPPPSCPPPFPPILPSFLSPPLTAKTKIADIDSTPFRKRKEGRKESRREGGRETFTFSRADASEGNGT